MTLSAALYFESDHAVAEKKVFASGQAVIFSRRAPDKEGPNEDAIALIPYDRDSGVLVVADGLGGERAGNEASRLAIEKISITVQMAAREETILREAILDGIEQANQAVMDLGLGAATTIALVEISEGFIRPYHVGDSMIMVTGQRGKEKFLSIPHSPVGYAVESGILDASEAVLHEERHVVSNVVGEADMRIDIGPTIKMAKRDTLVLASDGLSDNLYNEEIVSTVRKGDLLQAAGELIRRTTARMHQQEPDKPGKADDLSFILFRQG